MKTIEKSTIHKVVRGAKRAVYDRETIYAILDAGSICHVSYAMDGQPFVIPTAYGRIDDRLYLHGSVKSKSMLASSRNKVCVCITLLDGLVLARSAFHHSVNYRSVILYSEPKLVEDEEDKLKGLKAITENMLKGRWDEVRKPSKKELQITTVLELSLDTASAKVRTGGPVDEDADYALNVWAGELPIVSSFGHGKSDKKLSQNILTSPSVKAVQNKKI